MLWTLTKLASRPDENVNHASLRASNAAQDGELIDLVTNMSQQPPADGCKAKNGRLH